MDSLVIRMTDILGSPGLVTEVTPDSDDRLRPITTVTRSQFSQRPGEDDQIIYLLLGQVTPSGIR